jgi:hypothetical protein
MDLAAAAQDFPDATPGLSGAMKHMDAATNKLAAASMSFHAAIQDFRRAPNKVSAAT